MKYKPGVGTLPHTVILLHFNLWFNLEFCKGGGTDDLLQMHSGKIPIWYDSKVFCRSLWCVAKVRLF